MNVDFRSITKSILLRIIILSLISFYQPAQGQEGDTVLLPLRTLRIAIHVFQDDSGLGNFCHDSAGQEDFLRGMVDWVNGRLANLDTLVPAVSSPYVADSRVRVRLDTLFYHRDSKAWDCSSDIDSPYMRDRYVDGDSTLNYLQKYQTLPIFIGANNPVTGGHSRNMGDRGYIAVRGYYENFLRQPLQLSTDECGRNLVHELGHCLGLAHNFTGGPEGEQCDNCDDNGCPIQGTSNNIMDYWPSYGYGLSKCQFNQIQFYLNGGRGDISEVVINDSCYRVSGLRYRVTMGDTLEIADTVYLHGDLVVQGGGVLKVAGYLSMPGESGITLEAGARLEIEGGTIGNLCGDLWLGILAGDNSAVSPARISITRSGTVENARMGLTASRRVETEFENSIFRNCVESVTFLKGSSDTVRLANCTFLITSKLNHYEEGITPGCFFRADSIARLEVAGTRFINQPGPFIFDADWMGTGISVDGTSVRIVQSFFQNLTNGLIISTLNPDSKAELTFNRFTDNRYGINSCFKGVQLISDNQLSLQRFNSGNTIGICLKYPGRFAVINNRFESVYGGGALAAIVIKEAGRQTSPVFHNEFSNLPVGIFLDGAPRIDSVLFRWAEGSDLTGSMDLGPQFRYNRFDTVGMHLAMVTDSVYGIAAGTVSQARAETGIPATQWAPGGFAWYDDGLDLVAFYGWKQHSRVPADHGLYWFMNYLGLTPAYQGTGSGGYNDLKNYLKAVSDACQFPGTIMGPYLYDALKWAKGTPAAARSVGLAGYWNGFQAEDMTWLREALGSIAGRFTAADSLLTDLGTELAQRNLDSWIDFSPSIHPAFPVTSGLERASGYQLPDLSPFRFWRPEQDQSPPPAFSIYPNPAQNALLIRPEAGYSYELAWEGRIFSVDGRYTKQIRMESWDDQKLDISSLPPGIYLIELFTGIQYLGTAKFIKTTHR